MLGLHHTSSWVVLGKSNCGSGFHSYQYLGITSSIPKHVKVVSWRQLFGHGGPWRAMAGHGQPWPAVAAMATQARQANTKLS